MENEAKKCAVCGNFLTLDHFRRTPLSPDGHAKSCKQCVAAKHPSKNGCDRNPELAKFNVRELLDELRARGYVGTLRITKEIRL